MSDLTEQQVRDSIVPKSDQLNADDLLTGPVTVTIKHVKRGDREQPIVVELEPPHKPYKPCKSMRRVLIAVYSDDPKQWVGQRLTLYRDDSVTWAGVRVGGIRISHMSGIDEPKTLLLTQTRGKRSEVTIHPLVATATEQAYIADATKEIADAESMEMLKAIGFILEKKSQAVRDTLRPVYAKRKQELSE